MLLGWSILRHFPKGNKNIVADTLSRRYVLLNSLSAKMLGLHTLRNCMPLIMILLMCLLHVIKDNLVNFISMMVICLGKTSFVCLIVLCTSCK